MKKILFLIAPFFVLLFACNNNKEKGNGYDDYKNNRNRDDDRNNRNRDEDDSDSRSSIVGKWRIIDFESTDGEELSAEEKEKLRSSYIEFKRDGSYVATSMDNGGEPKKEYGTYEYDAREKTLVTIEEGDGKREELEVRFSGRSRVTLTFEEGKVTMEKD